MNIQKNDILELSDNIKYLVVSKVLYKNINYLYLVDIVDNSNIKFVTVDNDEVVIVTDKFILDKLLNLFMIDLKKSLSSK